MKTLTTPPAYDHSEQADGSDTIVIILANGYKPEVKERDVLNWMDSELIEWDDTDTAEERLDKQFDVVMERYYLEVVSK